MPLEIKKHEKETSQSLVRRFSKRIKNSGILIGARKNRYQTRTKSNQMKKKSALRRVELTAEYKMKEKMNKKPERKFRR